MRVPLLAASLLIAAGTALAQPAPDQMPPGPPPGPTPPPPDMYGAPPPGMAGQPGAPGQGRMPLKQRFAQANTTNDGRLTLEQAQAAGWRVVARNFAAIDRDQKGYVTMQDLREWMRARRAARSGQGEPPPPQ